MSSANFSPTFFDKANGTNASNSIFNAVQGGQSNHFNFGRAFYVEKFQTFCDGRATGAAFDSEAPKCLTGTRIEAKQKIRQWVDEIHGPPICCLQGPAGSGKSAIAQAIAEEYDGMERLAASFFLDPTSPDRRDITKFVSTIVVQLFTKVPETEALIKQAFKRDPFIADKHHKYQFKQLIIDPLLQLGKVLPRRVVVIDGLDQCDGEHWVEELLILLADACQDDRLSLRFLLTSRGDLDFPETPFERIYSFTLEDFDAHDDIREFLRSKFKKIYQTSRSMRHVAEAWPSPTDLERLVTNSSGLFAAASIIVAFVKNSISPFRELQAVLASLDDVGQPRVAYIHPYKPFIDHLTSLTSKDVGSQAAAITWLANTTGMNGGAVGTVNANAISSLVGFLRPTGDESITVSVCKILIKIATNANPTCAAWLNANAISPLIGVLASHNTLGQRQAMFALMKIITLPDHTNSAVPMLDAVPTFVGLLDSLDASIQASAAAVLQTIAKRGGTDNVVTAKAIPSLVQLLQESSNPVVLVVACATLRDIIGTSNIAQAKALDTDALIPSLLRLLSFTSDVRVQTHATFTLMDITLHDRASATALNLNVIPLLVSLLRSDNLHIQASAAATLENITARGRGAEDAIKAIPSLVNLLKSDDPTVLIAVCAALKNITSTSLQAKARIEALSTNAIQRLSSRDSSNELGIRGSAKAASENIILDDSSSVSGSTSGTITSLIEILTSSVTMTFLSGCLWSRRDSVGVGRLGFDKRGESNID